jgi:hypothetical protein
MAKLNQVIAVSDTVKTRAVKAFETAHRGWTPDRLVGLSRVYSPLTENGDQLPPETKIVQIRVAEILQTIKPAVVAFYDVVATQDTGNTKAKANVVVDGKIVLENVPVTALLFLEKQLATTIIPLIRNLPTLPADRTWKYDAARNCYVADPVQTIRTQKVPRTHVLSDATKEHPAQCQMYHDDVSVGTWTATHFSGAIPVAEQTEMLTLAEKLQDAVKKAREEANNTEVQQVNIGDIIWNFLFSRNK